MNILHLATFDAHGGAAVAALRLVDGLRRAGHEARLLVRQQVTDTPFVESAGEPAVRTDPLLAHVVFQLACHGRSDPQGTLFSSDLPTIDVAGHPLVRAADVLHLHWVTGFVSGYEVARLQQLGKPIVWTLHDQHPFTGGCHYAFSCRGFEGTCRDCPQLVPAARPLARLTLADRRRQVDARRLVIVSPSRWLARAARASSLFRGVPVHVVPYGIDVDARGAVERNDARAALGLDPDALVVFASSIDHRERRKGHAEFEEAMRICVAERLLAPREVRRLVVLAAGDHAPEGGVAGVPCLAIGRIDAEDPRLVAAYRAADAFALPTLADNLPNTLIEAMAAGVPAVAYATGGVTDVLRDGVNGRVVRRGDRRALAGALAAVLGNRKERERLGRAALATARERFDAHVQVAAIERICAEALAQTRRPVRTRLASFARDRFADAPGARRLLSDGHVMACAANLLHEETRVLQEVIASRGGEIRELREGLAARDDRIASLAADVRALEQAIAAERRAAGHLHRIAAGLHQATRRPGSLQVGVFGASEGAFKVLHALAEVGVIVDWFADNNPQLHGTEAYGAPVIAPAEIPARQVEAIVVGSVHAEAIRSQLRQLGVDPRAIVTPNLRTSAEALVAELAARFAPGRR